MADFAIDTKQRKDEEAGAIADAAPGRLIVRAFFRHRLAVVGLVVLAFIYFIALFAEFLSPSDPPPTTPITPMHLPRRCTSARERVVGVSMSILTTSRSTPTPTSSRT